MIYLEHTTDAQVVYIPRDNADAAGTLQFSLRSTVDLDTVIDAVVLGLNLFTRYYSVAVRLPDGCPSGEYEYTLTAGGDMVSTGCARINDPEQVDEYDKPIQYEQYE